MADVCLICGHEKALHRCWRLTCPENGGSMALLEQVRTEGVDAYSTAKRDSAAAGRRVAFGHPAQWPEPPHPEFML